MANFINEHEGEFKKAIEHFKGEITSLRTGRATPALVEDIQVEAYDGKMEIKGLASINVPDPKTITIDPWDKSLLQNIEKAINDSDVGISPVVDGTLIRLSLPPMTEENRKEKVKVLKQKAEQARISVRGIREKVRDAIIKAEEDKEISEDDKFKMQEELDKFVADQNKEIENITTEKEKEIMTI
jgi:ribosome recycling factor